MNIIVTGATGLLSRYLQSLDTSILCLPKEEYDITHPSIVEKLHELNPDIIIHAGAVTDSRMVIAHKVLSINTNIIGTAYISNYCIDKQKRLVYISTDYIYDGRRNTYHKESDSIMPQNDYAWTKLGGECSVRMVPNHVIIRTSFGESKFPYEAAWDNLFVSKDYVDVIAPKILEVAKSSVVGVLNVGTDRKTMFDYATQRTVVKQQSLQETLNFSLNLERYEQLFSNR